jgi:DNA-binding IclR family transcriptional regulator
VKSPIMPRPVKSAERALQVLELFELLQRPASLTEIAQSLGYPASSTSVLVNTLCRMGYINRDPATLLFAPTMRLPLLGGWIRAGGADGAALARLVAETRRATGLSAVLSMRLGISVQYVHVDRVQPQGFSSLRPNAGDLRPICASGAGFVMLAEEDDERIGLIARTASALQRRPIDLGNLMAKVNDARAKGYGWQVGTITPEVGDVATRIPVTDPFGKALVLSVGGAADRISADHEALGRTLRRMTRAFMKRIGGAPAPRAGAGARAARADTPA